MYISDVLSFPLQFMHYIIFSSIDIFCIYVSHSLAVIALSLCIIHIYCSYITFVHYLYTIFNYHPYAIFICCTHMLYSFIDHALYLFIIHALSPFPTYVSYSFFDYMSNPFSIPVFIMQLGVSLIFSFL